MTEHTENYKKFVAANDAFAADFAKTTNGSLPMPPARKVIYFI